MTSLTEELLETIADPCEPCREAVVALLEVVHDSGALKLTAQRVGCSGTEQLARRLRKHGFPSLSELRDWLWMCRVLWAHEVSRCTLEQQAFESGRDPSVLRRMVKRVANAPWSVVREKGLSGFLRSRPIRRRPCYPALVTDSSNR